MKLHYFGVGARAYPIRCGLFMSGVEFEDVIVNDDDLAHFPMQAVPVLEVEGKMICQTAAIMEYLGPITGLVPADNVAHAKHSELLGCIEDLYARLVPSIVEQEPEKKAALRVTFVEYLRSVWLPCVDAIIGVNRAKSGLCLYDAVTFADLWLSNTVSVFKRKQFDGVPPSICNRFRNLMKVYATVETMKEKMEYDASIRPSMR